MWKVVVAGLLTLLVSTSANNMQADNCSADGIGGCDLNARQCTWTQDNKWHQDSYKAKQMWVSGIGQPSAQLQSRMACSTNRSSHCLKFLYHFTTNNVIKLTFSIAERNGHTVSLWNRTFGSDNWTIALVDIVTRQNFSVKLESTKNISQNQVDSVYIAAIEYKSSPCASPSQSAAPPSPVTPEKPTPSSSPPSSLTATAGVSSSPTLPSSLLSSSSAKAKHTDNTPIFGISTTLTTLVEHTRHDAMGNSDNNSETTGSSDGLIIGVVVVVVIVLGISIIVFIALRRKRLLLGKTGTNGKQENESVVKPPPVEHLKQCKRNSEQRNPAEKRQKGQIDPIYDNHPLDRHTSAETSQMYCSVDAPELLNSHASQVFCTNNQLNNGQRFEWSHSSSENPYEVGNAETGVARDAYNTMIHQNRADKGNYVVDSTSVFKPITSLDQLQSNYSIARPMEADEAAGVYHYLEDDVVNQEQEAADRVYHILEEDAELNDKENAETPGLNHILEDDPTLSTSGQPVYHTSKGGIKQNKENKRQQHGQPMITSREKEDEYNSLDFTGKDTGGVTTDSDSDTVYNHLSETAEGVYNEVDRDKRAVVIDSEYAHIK